MAEETDPPFGYHDLERAALAFVLEDESWPVFLEWARENHISARCHEWLMAGPSLKQYRDEWVLHSPERGRNVRRV